MNLVDMYLDYNYAYKLEHQEIFFAHIDENVKDYVLSEYRGKTVVVKKNRGRAISILNSIGYTYAWVEAGRIDILPIRRTNIKPFNWDMYEIYKEKIPIGK